MNGNNMISIKNGEIWEVKINNSDMKESVSYVMKVVDFIDDETIILSDITNQGKPKRYIFKKIDVQFINKIQNKITVNS